MNKLISLLVVVATASVAHANGFLLNEFDAKVIGRGEASAATDVDPSAIYFNIGGLAAGVNGTVVQIGGASIIPAASFTDDATKTKTDSNTGTQYVPSLFVASRVTDMFTVGLGFYTPFGLTVTWPESSAPAQTTSAITLRTFFVTPSVGVNLGSFVPGLSVGAGIDIVPATVELKQIIPFGTDPPGSAHLGMTATGVGARLGVMYKPNSLRQMSFGLMWRSDVKEDFSGTGAFKVDPSTPQYRSLLPMDGDVKTSLTLPQSITGGASYLAMPDLEFEADILWTNWSKFKNLPLTTPDATGTTTMTINQVQNFSDTFTWRFGGEYRFPRLGAAVRGGFIWDPTPTSASHETSILPDTDRFGLTLGASKSWGDYSAHLGLLWVLPGSQKTATPAYIDPMNTPQQKGTYELQAFVASVTLQAQLGASK